MVQVKRKHSGLSIIFTVTDRGTMRGKIFHGALNADILIGFIERLIRENQRKVHLRPANWQGHHSKPVKARLAMQERDTAVFSTCRATADSSTAPRWPT